MNPIVIIKNYLDRRRRIRNAIRLLAASMVLRDARCTVRYVLPQEKVSKLIET